jgi:hypothetical protein
MNLRDKVAQSALCVQVALESCRGLGSYISPPDVQTVYMAPFHLASSSVGTMGSFSAVKAACTRWNLARASQVAGMRAQTFHGSYGNLDRVNFEASCDFQYATCMKRLRAFPRLDSRDPTFIVYTRLKAWSYSFTSKEWQGLCEWSFTSTQPYAFMVR